MKKKTTFLLLILTIFLTVQTVMAVPQLPHKLFGQAFDDGAPLADGTEIVATIGSGATAEQVSTTVYSSGASNGLFAFDLPADDPDTTADEGGVDDELIQFAKADGQPFTETTTFFSGRNEPLDINLVLAPRCFATADAGALVFSSINAEAVQQAADAALAASGDTILIAGICQGGLGANHAVLTVNGSLNVFGGYDGTDWTTADPMTNPTILDANSEGRVIEVVSGDLAVDGLTLRGGLTIGEDGAGIYAPEGSALLLTQSVLENNVAGGSGGGVYSLGETTIQQSLMTANSAENQGGGIFMQSGEVVNSTISGNSAESGGGISIGCCDGSGVLIASVTLVENSAATGANIHNQKMLTLQNSLVANGSGDVECQNDGTFISNGFNIVEGGACINDGGFLGPNDSFDQVDFDSLADNGGPTHTHALPSNSAAINTGGQCEAVDQRGETRADSCDIGAYETTFSDLVATDLQADVETVCAGHPIQIDYGFANAGSSSAGFDITLYDDDDSTGFSNAIQTTANAGLMGGEAMTGTLAYTPLMTGTRYLKLQVDSGATVAETSETNNDQTTLLNVIDSQVPKGNMVINFGAAWTYSFTVDLDIWVLTSNAACSSQPTEMRTFFDGQYGEWMPIASKIENFDMSSPAPYEPNVFLQFRDAAGNMSELFGDGIGIDTDVPWSVVNEPSGISFDEQFDVNWSVQETDSERADTRVEVKVNEGEWQTWIESTELFSAEYSGTVGNTYCFRTFASDTAGQIEMFDAANPDFGVSCVAIVGPETGIDLMPSEMTVLQVVQTAANTIPLVEDKPTLVRVGITLPDGADDIANVDGLLHVSRDGVELDGSPIALDNAPFTAQATFDRNSDSDLMHFRLPAEWLNGTLEFYVEIDPSNTIAESNEGNNRYPSSGTLDMTFEKVMPLEITIVPITAMFSDDYNFGFEPYLMEVSDAQIAETVAFLEQVFPINELIINVHEPYFYDGLDRFYFGIPHPNSVEVLDAIVDIQEAELPNPAPNQLYYGIIANSSAVLPQWTTTGGVAYKPGTTGIGMASAGPTMAHEVGHNTGLSHVACEDTTPPFEEAYPFEDGSIGYQAWDSARNSIVPNTDKAFMSYCGPEWVSTYTYLHLFNRLRVTEEAPAPRSVATATEKSASQDILFISGQAKADGTAGSLTSSFALPDFAQATSAGSKGPFRVSLVDSNGVEVESLSFGEPKIGRASFQPETFGFRFSLPQIADLQAARLYYEGFLLDEITVGTLPSVNITSADPTTGDYTLTWTGDATSYFVRYSADNGNTWSVLSPPTTANELFIDADYLKGSDNALLQVFGSRDLQTQATVLGPFTISDKVPSVLINNPVNEGQIFVAGETALFIGQAFDLEDGTLADANVTWSSSADGVLGTGSNLEIDMLSIGRHTITLTGTDSEGQSVSAETTIEVVPAGVAEIQAIDGAGVYEFGRMGVTVEVVNTGNCLDVIQIVQFDQDHPNASAGLQTGRYWRIGQAGCLGDNDFSINLTLPVNGALGGLDALCRWDGNSTWDCAANVYDTEAGTITVNNVSQLGDWTIGIDAVPSQINGLIQSVSHLQLSFWLILGSAVGLFELTIRLTRKEQ